MRDPVGLAEIGTVSDELQRFLTRYETNDIVPCDSVAETASSLT
jgi:hypothetical protein